MTAPAPTLPKPLFMRWVSLQITDAQGVTHGYECEVTQAGLTPSGGDQQSLTTLCPEGSFSEATERVWSLVLTGVQDFETQESLTLFLLEHDGETAQFLFYPKVDRDGTPVGRGFKGTVTVAPPDQIGNVASGSWATFTVTMGLQGKYTMVDEAGNPIGGPATGAAAGSPGTWTPVGSKTPPTMADAPPLTGQPAWATDQYVRTGAAAPGNEIRWNGTAWIAYTGPHKAASAPGDVFPSDITVIAEDATNAAQLTTNGYVALPTTDWLPTEQITVNTHDFHWNGTAWVAGAHP